MTSSSQKQFKTIDCQQQPVLMQNQSQQQIQVKSHLKQQNSPQLRGMLMGRSSSNNINITDILSTRSSISALKNIKPVTSSIDRSIETNQVTLNHHISKSKLRQAAAKKQHQDICSNKQKQNQTSQPTSANSEMAERLQQKFAQIFKNKLKEEVSNQGQVSKKQCITKIYPKNNNKNKQVATFSSRMSLESINSNFNLNFQQNNQYYGSQQQMVNQSSQTRIKTQTSTTNEGEDTNNNYINNNNYIDCNKTNSYRDSSNSNTSQQQSSSNSPHKKISVRDTNSNHCKRDQLKRVKQNKTRNQQLIGGGYNPIQNIYSQECYNSFEDTRSKTIDQDSIQHKPRTINGNNIPYINNCKALCNYKKNQINNFRMSQSNVFNPSNCSITNSTSIANLNANNQNNNNTSIPLDTNNKRQLRRNEITVNSCQQLLAAINNKRQSMSSQSKVEKRKILNNESLSLQQKRPNLIYPQSFNVQENLDTPKKACTTTTANEVTGIQATLSENNNNIKNSDSICQDSAKKIKYKQQFTKIFQSLFSQKQYKQILKNNINMQNSVCASSINNINTEINNAVNNSNRAYSMSTKKRDELIKKQQLLSSAQKKDKINFQLQQSGDDCMVSAKVEQNNTNQQILTLSKKNLLRHSDVQQCIQGNSQVTDCCHANLSQRAINIEQYNNTENVLQPNINKQLITLQGRVKNILEQNVRKERQWREEKSHLLNRINSLEQTIQNMRDKSVY